MKGGKISFKEDVKTSKIFNGVSFEYVKKFYIEKQKVRETIDELYKRHWITKLARKSLIKKLGLEEEE